MACRILSLMLYQTLVSRLAIGVLLALVLARPAAAHPAPFSYLDIVFRNGSIDGTLVVHVIDVAHELKIDAARSASRSGRPRPSRQQHHWGRHAAHVATGRRRLSRRG